MRVFNMAMFGDKPLTVSDPYTHSTNVKYVPMPFCQCSSTESEEPRDCKFLHACREGGVFCACFKRRV